MAELGRFGVLLALAVSSWAVFAALHSARQGRREAMESAEGALRAAALGLTVAALALFHAFVTRDFSVEYVASHSSRSLSTFYTLAAFWAGQPGSLLLWAWVLSLYGVVVVRLNRTRNRELMPYVVAVLAAVVAFFAFIVAFPSNPFRRLPFAPLDGSGLNPMLQNPGQMIHPVTMYLGYVGFTVPFAFCIAALATGRLDDTWIRTVRHWTLWAWLLLTAGIVFGARWAYVELGWGGYWAWDPVENASLLPWLTATAYLHSVMIQERKGMLKVWNVGLAATTFALALFGLCPMMAWRKASGRRFTHNLVVPVAVGLASAVATAGLTGGQHRGVIVMAGLAAFVTFTIVEEFRRAAGARRAARRESWARALVTLLSRNPRRYGGYVIHLGVVVMVVGMTFHSAFNREYRQTLRTGEEARVGRYALTLEGIETDESAARFATIAVFRIRTGGRDLGRLRSEKAVFVSQDQPVSEVGIRSSPREDLYVIVDSADITRGVVSARFLVNPGVFWIWAGATTVLAGGLLVAWPRRRTRREVVSDEARVVAETVAV